jgi:hypothetical protein
MVTKLTPYREFFESFTGAVDKTVVNPAGPPGNPHQSSTKGPLPDFSDKK